MTEIDPCKIFVKTRVLSMTRYVARGKIAQLIASALA